jgi:hypothetical protein
MSREKNLDLLNCLGVKLARNHFLRRGLSKQTLYQLVVTHGPDLIVQSR